MPRKPDEGFGARMRAAKRRYEQERDPERVTDRLIGERVAVVLKRAKPFTQASVSKWLKGHVPDELPTIRAIALVLGVHPGWLAFGNDGDDVFGETLVGGK